MTYSKRLELPKVGDLRWDQSCSLFNNSIPKLKNLAYRPVNRHWLLEPSFTIGSLLITPDALKAICGPDGHKLINVGACSSDTSLPIHGSFFLETVPSLGS